MALEKHWVAALEDHGPGVAAHQRHIGWRAIPEEVGPVVRALYRLAQEQSRGWRIARRLAGNNPEGGCGVSLNDLAAHIGRGLRSEIIRKRLDVCVGELGCDGSHDAIVVRACPGA
jgi:hypothetical protein